MHEEIEEDPIATMRSEFERIHASLKEASIKITEGIQERRLANAKVTMENMDIWVKGEVPRFLKRAMADVQTIATNRENRSQTHTSCMRGMYECDTSFEVDCGDWCPLVKVEEEELRKCVQNAFGPTFDVTFVTACRRRHHQNFEVTSKMQRYAGDAPVRVTHFGWRYTWAEDGEFDEIECPHARKYKGFDMESYLRTCKKEKDQNSGGSACASTNPTTSPSL